MKKTIYMPLIAILVAAAVLFGVAFALNGIANKNAQAAHMKDLQTLLPGSTEFTREPYEGEDKSIRRIHKGETGFVFEIITDGYVDQLTVHIGVSNDGKVTGLVVRDMAETWGLGSKVLTDWQFLAQFLGNEGDAEIGTNIDAISGATVTSKAIARCVNTAVAYVTGADIDSGATAWGG